EGGLFVSRHSDVAEAVARLRAFMVDRKHDERTVPGMYDVTGVGLNYRMSEPQAALGRGQLRRIDENLARRRTNFERISEAVAAVPGATVIAAVEGRARNSHYCLGLLLDEELGPRRLDLVARLNGAGVGTSVYYPQPVPRMTYYRERYGYDESR